MTGIEADSIRVAIFITIRRFATVTHSISNHHG